MQYNETIQDWGIIKKIDDFVETMTPIGTLRKNDNSEIAIYLMEFDGSGHYVEAGALKYDKEIKDYIYEPIISEVTARAYPKLDEEKETLIFEGDSHVETFMWDGEEFDSIIARRKVDIDADIEIHYSIINGKVVFANYNSDEIIKVRKGNVIAFIQDNVGDGELERVSFEKGLVRHETENNYLTVTEAGMDIDLLVRINYDFFLFKIRSLREYSSNLNGEKLILEDLLIEINEDLVLEVGGDVDSYISYLGDGHISEMDVSPNDDSYILYEYEKDGIRLYYYDNKGNTLSKPYLYIAVIDSPKYSTFRGLRTGDSYDKMIELYGIPEFVEKYDDRAVYFYSSDDDYSADLVITLNSKTNSVVAYNISSPF